MARLSFRDRFFTPPVARAMTSPAGIIAAGAGISAGILLAAPLAAAVGLGAVAWAGRVALAVPRDPSAERIDPFTLSDPWRRYVQEALDSQRQFDQATQRAPKGPLRDRLKEIGDRLDTGTSECWRVARHAEALMEARRSVDVAGISRDLQAVLPQAQSSPDTETPAARTAEALQAQLATAGRMDQTLAEAESRLRLLDARLGEAVTRAIELSVQAHDTEDLIGLQGEVDSVVSDMEALRLALRETEQRPDAVPMTFPPPPAAPRPAPPLAPPPPGVSGPP